MAYVILNLLRSIWNVLELHLDEYQNGKILPFYTACFVADCIINLDEDFETVNKTEEDLMFDRLSKRTKDFDKAEFMDQKLFRSETLESISIEETKEYKMMIESFNNFFEDITDLLG